MPDTEIDTTDNETNNEHENTTDDSTANEHRNDNISNDNILKPNLSQTNKTNAALQKLLVKLANLQASIAHVTIEYKSLDIRYTNMD